MIYAPWNEFCMIWVIFLMPTDQVMAFLCFIFDNQSVDMSGQVWGGGRGGHNWKKQVCLKMLFRQFQVFLAHVFFFLIGKLTLADPPPSYWNFPTIFFLKPSLMHWCACLGSNTFLDRSLFFWVKLLLKFGLKSFGFTKIIFVLRKLDSMHG